MKRLFFILILAVSANVLAQGTSKEDIDIIQSIYGKSKLDLVKGYMTFSDSEMDAFMKVYDKYEADRKALGRKKIQLIDDYAQNYASLTDEKADELSKEILKNNLDYQKLFSDYYKKFKKAIGPMKSAQFLQLEIYLQTTIQAELQDAVPFIGEIDRSKKQ